MAKYTLVVDDELWEAFKRTVTRDKTLNQVLVEMIAERVRQFGGKARKARPEGGPHREAAGSEPAAQVQEGEKGGAPG